MLKIEKINKMLIEFTFKTKKDFLNYENNVEALCLKNNKIIGERNKKTNIHEGLIWYNNIEFQNNSVFMNKIDNNNHLIKIDFNKIQDTNIENILITASLFNKENLDKITFDIFKEINIKIYNQETTEEIMKIKLTDFKKYTSIELIEIEKEKKGCSIKTLNNPISDIQNGLEGILLKYN